MQINYDFFYRSAELGDINGLERMIQQGANIHERCDYVLICAICANQTETAIWLLEHGIDLQEVKETAMIFASASGNISMLEYLVNHGVPVNLKSSRKYRDRPLFSAVMCEQVETVKFLCEHGATVTKRTLELANSRENYSDVILNILNNYIKK